MAFELPSRFSPMDTLEKKPTERAADYVTRMYNHCWHRCTIYGEHEKIVPSYISALVIHCLPDYEPYTIFKNSYDDLYLPNGVPNYVKYGDHVTGQWIPTWSQLGEELTVMLANYYNHVNAPAQNVHHNDDVSESGSVSSALGGTHSGWYHSNDDFDDGNSRGNLRRSAEVRSPSNGHTESSADSSCYEIPNPNPVTPVYVELSSDSEMTNEEDDPINDPEFTPETYKVSRDKREGVNY